jgi:hypothetical protein
MSRAGWHLIERMTFHIWVREGGDLSIDKDFNKEQIEAAHTVG